MGCSPLESLKEGLNVVDSGAIIIRPTSPSGKGAVENAQAEGLRGNAGSLKQLSTSSRDPPCNPDTPQTQDGVLMMWYGGLD